MLYRKKTKSYRGPFLLPPLTKRVLTPLLSFFGISVMEVHISHCLAISAKVNIVEFMPYHIDDSDFLSSEINASNIFLFMIP